MEQNGNQKLLITRWRQHTISALYDGHSIIELHAFPDTRESILHNIYIGKVKDIVKNINAAFIEFSSDHAKGYYSISENSHPIFIHPKSNAKLVAGDELIVQVKQEKIKTKDPVLTSQISLTGQYIILTVGNNSFNISSKLTDSEKREQLRKKFASYCTEEFGFIVRTNAKNVSFLTIQKELEELIHKWQEIKERAIHRTCFSILYSSPKGYLCSVRDTYSQNLKEIVTDQQDLYEEIQQYLKQDISMQVPLRLYEDLLQPLYKHYPLESTIERALQEKVWLKSGAYLVIQPTEALTVIDVNTGKCVSKNNVQETFLRINKEAAKAAAAQIRLRNLSGIILIDFINMATQEAKEELLSYFRACLKEDPIKTSLVDMTRLELVEVTRKKVRPPIYEIFREIF